MGWKMWLWCLLSCALAIPFVYFLCPETTGKALEEIDLLFAREDMRSGSLDEEIRGGGGKEGTETEHAERVTL